MPFGIWDVSDPAAPEFLGPLSLGNYFQADDLGDKPNDNKAVHGNYFYAVYSTGEMGHGAPNKDHHLAIVDLSDPQNPVIASHWEDTKQVRLTALSVNPSGTRVYVLGQFGRKEILLYVLDVQDPANPLELARFVWPLPFAGGFSPGRPVSNADDSLVVFADGSWEDGRESRASHPGHLRPQRHPGGIYRRLPRARELVALVRQVVLGARRGDQRQPGLLDVVGRRRPAYRRLGPGEPRESGGLL